MNRTMIRGLLMAGVAAASLGHAVAASAATVVVTSPYTSANIFIGRDTRGDARVYFQRAGSTECSSARLGNSNGLFNATEVRGGSGPDTFRINMASTFTCDTMSVSLYTGIVYGAWFLDTQADGGADQIRSGSSSTISFAKGGPGNDELRGYASNVRLFGEDGDDKLKGYGNGSNEGYDGGSHNDCIEDAGYGYSSLVCGAGDSDRVNASGPSSGCEMPITTACLQ